VKSLTDNLEKETESRLAAEQRAQDASLRVDVLSSYFNEKEKEFDRYPLLFTFIFLLRDAIYSADYAFARCLSVMPQYSVEMAKHIIELFHGWIAAPF